MNVKVNLGSAASSDGDDSEDSHCSSSSDSDEVCLESEGLEVAAPSGEAEAPVDERTTYAMADVGPLGDLPEDPPIRFPFEVDDFQKRALIRVTNFESFFVSAHTSSGKTVCALYAIASALRNQGRAVYTAPIKALSNQKYREFLQFFPSVGIITGDVSLNPEASVLIMTTEILRKYLYTDDKVVAHLDWVIYDECHYINDPERGVVWEETIIMLPLQCRMVFLSATVPNFMDFCEWVGQIKKQPIWAITTNYRPTPLYHYLWYTESKTAYELMDNEGKIKPLAIRECVNWRAQQEAKKKADRERENRRYVAPNLQAKPQKSWMQKMDKSMNDLRMFVEHLNVQDLLPVTIFVFSRAMVERIVEKAFRNVVLLEGPEESAVISFFNKATVNLTEDEKKLPQVLSCLDLLKRGIAYHHSGLLPILKEVVEILFQDNLVRVLVATETFAMGVNMPARSVCFFETSKFDGYAKRPLRPGEYTQMAGRAGRRGKDKVGSVFIFVKDQESIPPEKHLRLMMSSKPQPLSSQFRVTSAMILRMIQRSSAEKEMLTKSFGESSRYRKLLVKATSLAEKKLEKKDRVAIQCVVDPDQVPIFGFVMKVSQISSELADIHLKLWEYRGFPIFVSGRLVSFLLGDRLMVGAYEESLPSKDPRMRVFTLGGSQEIGVSQLLMVYKEYRDPKLQNLRSKLTPILSDPKVRKNLDFMEQDTIDRMIEEYETLLQSPCLSCPHLDLHFKEAQKQSTLDIEVLQLESQIGKDTLYLSSNYDHRLRFLKNLEYIEKDSLTVKGQVACVLLNDNDITLCESLFRHVFEGLTPAETAALVSVFFVQSRMKNTGPVDHDGYMVLPANVKAKMTRFVEGQQKVLDFHNEVYDKSYNNHLEVDEEWTAQVNFCCMDLVLLWAQGESFFKVMDTAATGGYDIQEGGLVQIILKTDEALRRLINVSEGFFNNPTLCQLFEAASQCIHRDIIFARSLYFDETN